MYTYTVNEIVTIADTLERIANAGLTGKIAYFEYRNLSKTSKIVADYNRTREELITKYGEPDEDVEGQIIVKRTSSNYQKFVDDLTEVLSGTEDVDLYKIQESDLDKLADADLSVSDFAIIDNYLVDHPEEEEENEEAEAPESE